MFTTPEIMLNLPKIWCGWLRWLQLPTCQNAEQSRHCGTCV